MTDFLKVLVISLLLVLPVSILAAHTGATGIVKERMDAMKDIAAQMKLIAATVKGTTAYSAENIEAAAKRIAGHAKKAPALFPENSNPMPSEALELIWQEWPEFKALTPEMEQSALQLAKTAAASDDAATLNAPFLALAKTCKSCHQKYRKEK